MSDERTKTSEKDPDNLVVVGARLPDAFNAIAFSPDGRTLASGSSDGTVKLWDSSSGMLQATYRSLPPTHEVVFVLFALRKAAN